MTMVKNEDFKIIKGEKNSLFINFTQKLLNTIFARIAVSILTIILGLILQ